MTEYKAQSDYLFNPKSATYVKPNDDSIAVDKIKIYTDDSPSGYITIKPRKTVTRKGSEVIDGVEHPTESTGTEMYDIDDLPEGYHELVSEINDRDVRVKATVLEIINEGSQNYMVIQPENKDTIVIKDPENIGEDSDHSNEAENPEDFKESNDSDEDDNGAIF